MLKAINLSLSSICGGNCIFCPSDKGKSIKQKIMPFEYLKKIVDEISSDEFKKNHSITSIQVSENGDAFLNKDFIKMLRYIKLNLPEVRVNAFTNFQYFTKDKAEIILKEKLIDLLCCNIDGSNQENYYNVKKLNLEVAKKNLIDFLEARKRLNSQIPLKAMILTLYNYIHTIYNNYGFYPTKLEDINLKDVPDDLKEIRKQLKGMLKLQKDRIRQVTIISWAEREKIDIQKIDYSKYSCPNLKRIKKEAFIAPDGTWYACCLDSNNKLVLGNVIKESINEVYLSKERGELIGLLKNQEFKKIGEPCNTVNCCQNLSL